MDGVGLPEAPAALAAAIGLVEDTMSGAGMMDDAGLLSAARAAGHLADRARAAELSLLAAMASRGTTSRAAGQQTPSWLHDSNRVSSAQARARVRQAARLADHPRIADAVGSGAMSIEQADAVLAWLRFMDPELSVYLTHEQLDRVQEQLIDWAGEHDPDALRLLAKRALEVAAPDIADELERRALERQEAEANKKKWVRYETDLDAGSTFVRAKLPTADADQLKVLIEAHAAAARRDRSAETADPADLPLTEVLRADGLIALADTAAAAGAFPAHGGDRPRLTIVVGAQQLAERTGVASILETGTALSPGRWLRAACDADLLPVVVDTTGVVLDVGRTKRLVDGDLRQALALRDQGCAYPGCDRPARSCEAHHITPWATGGTTSLANTVLLCRHHHGLVEPDPRSAPGTRWQVRMGTDQIPEFLPPDTAYGPRGPQRHARYRIRTERNNTDTTASGPDPP